MLEQEEVAHPSKYAATRLGYLRGADLSTNKRSERDSGAESKKPKSSRRSTLSASGRGAAGRRRSTLGGGGRSGRQRSSVGRAGGRKRVSADADGGNQSSVEPGGKKRSLFAGEESDQDRSGRDLGVTDGLQV